MLEPSVISPVQGSLAPENQSFQAVTQGDLLLFGAKLTRTSSTTGLK